MVNPYTLGVERDLIMHVYVTITNKTAFVACQLLVFYNPKLFQTLRHRFLRADVVNKTELQPLLQTCRQ